MPSMKEVARMAGVSVSTVSRVLSKKIPVDEETRRKVLAAVDTLGYQPNLLAQSLRSRRSKTLALLVPDITNPAFSTIVCAAETAAHSLGYSLMLCNTLEDAQREAQYLSVLSQRWVDGLIFSRVQDEDAVMAVLNKGQIPVVIIDRALEAETVPSVVVDNERAGRLATAHLLSLGHRAIACVTGPGRLRLTRERLRGYQKALAEAGIPFDPALVCEGAFKTESGYTAARALLTQRPDITAFFAMNDFMAIGCMQAARDRGFSVPADVSVVGMDNTHICTLVAPQLTSLAQPFERMAIEAVEMLVRLSTRQRLKAKHVVLQPELVVRSTTAPRIATVQPRVGGV